MTKGEFYQTLVNLLSERIAPKYSISRTDVKSWLKKVGNSSYEYKTFDRNELTLIAAAPNLQTALQNGKELNIYLKYCMFNAAKCGFSVFEEIGE